MTGPANFSPGPNVQAPTITNYTSTTDTDGNFVFEDIDPGRFSLSAERTGYVRTMYGSKGPNLPATPLTLSASQKMTGVLIKMTPQALIAGKVTDEDGDPFPGCIVQLYRVTWNQGRKQLQPMSGSSTLPDGTFMIGGLAAGKYYLGATNNQMRITGMRERNGRKEPQEAYVTTYYPNALEAPQAAPIEVTAGIDLRGIEIRMRKARVFRIAGRAVHSSGASTSGAVLMLNSVNDLFSFNRQPSFIRDKEGAFEFSYVLPGSYFIQPQPGGVRSSDGSGPLPMLGRLAVTVGNEDIDNLVMTLGPGVEISGQFTLDGVGPLNAEARAKLASATNGSGSTTPGGAGRQLALQLLAAEGISFNAPNSQNKDDGSFVMKSISPERYRMTPIGLPEGCYVKQIRYGGQDVTRSLLDLTAGSGGQIEIVLSPNAAQISGTVRNEKGEVAKDIAVTVWQPVDGQPGVQEFFRSLRTDQNGSFKVTSLPPGDYRVIAWEQVEPGMANDSDFRSKFESKATAVKLQENSRETVEPKLLPSDVIEAEAAKIR
jgi:hypothetical protein